MNILQLHTNKNGLMNKGGYPNGGLEKVIIDTHISLNRNGHSCYSVDSMNCNFKHHNVLNINPKKDSWKKEFKIWKSTLLNIIDEYEIDSIIVHGANSIIKFLTENNKKILFVDHQQHVSINKLYHEGLFGYYIPMARDIGSLFYSVSEMSAVQKSKRVNEQKLYPGHFSYDGWLKFQYINDEFKNITPIAGNQRIITVGRSDTDKNPHRIKKLAAKFNTKYEVVTMLHDGGSEREAEYFTKHFSDVEDVSLNIDRNTTINKMMASSIYYSTCDTESAGITAIESLSLGVPVVLYENKNFQHASRMFMPDSKYLLSTLDEQFETKYKQLLAMNLEERIEVQKQCHLHNKEEDFVANLVHVLSKVGLTKNQSISLFS